MAMLYGVETGWPESVNDDAVLRAGIDTQNMIDEPGDWVSILTILGDGDVVKGLFLDMGFDADPHGVVRLLSVGVE